MQFKDLNIIEPILEALKEEGYTNPTPIQAQSIPIVLEGTDLLGCAQTGTGKTAAFAIPILQLLSANPPKDKKKKIRSLIVRLLVSLLSKLERVLRRMEDTQDLIVPLFLAA